MIGSGVFLRFAAAAASALAVAGCLGGGSGGGSSAGAAPAQPGNALTNLFFWGSATVPAPPPLPVDDDFECPPISIAANGASVRVGGDVVRVQYSMGDVARECQNVQPGGAHTLKLGAEGRVLLGPAGAPGRYDVTVRFTVKAGEAVIASRVQRQAVVIAAGAAQGSFQMIEEGISVPGGRRDLEIEVGFSQGGAPAERRRRR